MTLKRKLRLVLAAGVLTSTSLLGLLTPALGGASTPGSTITFAEAPGASPNWIFPFTGFQNYSVANVNQFQQLMFRPLYFFGLGATTGLVPTLSLANPPLMSDGNRTVTLNLKGWRFANGQVVDAQSVMFFLNLYAADPTSYAGYTPGVGIPDQVASAHGSGLTVVIHMKTPVNTNWLLYNYLSQITPLSNSWDVTGPHTPGHCATGAYATPSTKNSCKVVEAYLDKLSAAPSTFASAFWQNGADGPWKLASFDALGNATFVANANYSGPQRAQVKYVKEVAYTSQSQQWGDLLSGKLDLGYVNPTTLKIPAPAPGKVGTNDAALIQKYRLSVVTPYSFNYALLNFSSSNPLQAEFAQLYIRQALQESLNQAGIIRSVLNNYGAVADSPLPPTTLAALSKTPTNPYPYNLNHAKALLSSHGWSEVSGIMTCSNPGIGSKDCGANIPGGARLSFALMYVTGSPIIDNTVNALVANWANIGVAVTASANTFNNLVSECAVGSGTSWSICWSGQGWSYAPNYYPSGEQLFYTNARSNWGGYSDARMNALVRTEMTGRAPLSAFEQYAANQLPVLYMPSAEQTVETRRSLKSSVGWSSNGLENFMPEYLHY